MNCIVLGVTKSGTRLSDFHIVFVLKYSLKVVFESFWYQFSSVQSLSCVQFSATSWTSAHQASVSITNSQSPPKPMSSELMMPSNYLILCRPLLLLPQSFPASGSFPMSQLFAPGGQSIGVSASTSVLPMNSQDWAPLGWTGRIFLQSKGLSRVFSDTTVQKHQFFGAQFSFFLCVCSTQQFIERMFLVEEAVHAYTHITQGLPR